MLIQYTAKSGKSYEKECCLNISYFAGCVIKKPVNTLVLTGFCLFAQIKCIKNGQQLLPVFMLVLSAPFKSFNGKSKA